jgi:hypothetical protein
MLMTRVVHEDVSQSFEASSFPAPLLLRVACPRAGRTSQKRRHRQDRRRRLASVPISLQAPAAAQNRGRRLRVAIREQTNALSIDPASFAARSRLHPMTRREGLELTAFRRETRGRDDPVETQ